MTRSDVRSANTGTSVDAFISVALLVMPLLWLCGGTLINDRVFAFRDASRFYYPLFEWTSSEWKAGRIPLWNPRENCGTSVVGETSSSLFYPGQFIFLLPGPHGWKFNAYVVIHLSLAAFLCYFVGRKWGYSRPGSALAGISYAYGAPVLFNYSNIIFLVSAAWLPLAMYFVWNLLSKRSTGSVVGLAMTVTAMTLGGDPHTAYNVFLFALLGTPLYVDPPSRYWKCVGHRVVLLIGSATLFVALAAIQFVPAIEWAWHSERLHANADNGLLNHAINIYDFSVAPWRVSEFIWPNIMGKMFPVHQRWGDAIPAEGRIWNPSLYVGLVALSLSLLGIGVRRGALRNRWLTVLVALSTLASFGAYGVGWIIGEVGNAFGAEVTIKNFAPIGGIYWLFATVAPGYSVFRYPAKWIVFASFGISQLAGSTLTNTDGRELTRSRIWWYFATASAGLLVILCVGWSKFGQAFEHAGPDPILGPLDVAGAMRCMAMSLAQAMFVCALVGIGGRFARITSPRSCWLFVVLAVADVCLANRWLVHSVPRETLERKSSSSQMIDGLRESSPSSVRAAHAVRVFRSESTFALDTWPTSSNEARLDESLQADADSMFLKLPLRTTEGNRFDVVETHGSVWNADYRTVLELTRRPGFGSPHVSNWPDIQRSTSPNLDAMRALGVEFVIMPKSELPNRTWKLVGKMSPRESDWGIWQVDNPLPRARIVHQFVRFPNSENSNQFDAVRSAVPESSPADRSMRRASRIWWSGKTATDLGQVAFVESDEPHAESKPVEVHERTPTGTASIVHEDPRTMVIDVDTDPSGLLVVSDLYFPGWTATISSNGSEPKPIPIVRTNHIMRGVFIPRGRHQVTFTYRPTSFLIGVTISAQAWLMLAIGSWLIRSRRMAFVRGIGE